MFSLSIEMSRLARDGTAEPVSRDQILRRERGHGKIIFPCSADHKQDWQPYPVDPSLAICDGHTYILELIHLYNQPAFPSLQKQTKQQQKNGSDAKATHFFVNKLLRTKNFVKKKKRKRVWLVRSDNLGNKADSKIPHDASTPHLVRREMAT